MQPLMAVAHELNGRMHKRLPIAIVVRLASIQDDPADTPELTYTENVSAHGACVVSRSPWHRGELAQVTSFGEQIRLRAKVIHCRKFSANRYAVGLTVQGHEVAWLTFRSFATS
jgi:hypothetical protein